MPKRKRPEPTPEPAPSPSRVLAWHMAADISWVAIYRGAMLGLGALTLTLIGWQSNRIINRQEDMATQISGMRTEVSVDQTNILNMKADVAALAVDVMKVDTRVSRTNDRQMEMSGAIRVLESQIADLRAAAGAKQK